MVKNLPAKEGDTSCIPGARVPWSREAWVPHPSSLCSRAWEPRPLRPRAAAAEAWHPRARAPLQERPPPWKARAPQLQGSPRLLHLERSSISSEDPAQPLNKLKKQTLLYIYTCVCVCKEMKSKLKSQWGITVEQLKWGEDGETDTLTLFMGMYNGTATLENILAVSYKVKDAIIICISLLGLP